MPELPGGVPNKVYMSCHFGFQSATPWYGENAQVGLRLAMVPIISAPGLGDLFTLESAETIDLLSVSGSDATWTWAQTFQATWGNLLDGRTTFGLAEQLDCANDVVTWWNALKAAHSSHLRLESVKFAPVQPLGRYSCGASEFRLKTPLAGTSASTKMPPETSVAVSIMADVIGRRARGRMFLPGLSATYTDTGGKVDPIRSGLVNTATKALIDNLQDLPGVPGVHMPIVTVCSNDTPTGYRPSLVRVGDHFDVQRRRQHQVQEAYISLGL